MKSVAIIVYEDAFLSAMAAIIDLLTTTNQLLRKEGRPPAFKLILVGVDNDKVMLEWRSQFDCQKTLAEVQNADLVIIPAFKGDRDPMKVLAKNEAVVPWLQRMYAQGSEVASLCFGAYFLAEAGLLNGKNYTSHWLAMEELKKRYPKAKVKPDAVLTDEEGIYTGGGGFSSLNLLSYIISKFCGRSIALKLSKLFSIDLDRVTQSHFFVFQGQRRHNDQEIHNAQTIIEKNYKEITVGEVAEQLPMSKRSFIRRFKKSTQYTPQEYLQRVKVEAAKKMLEREGKHIKEVMYEVGYTDLKFFGKMFKKYTNLTPTAYGRKYRRILASV
ncbi:MAG TPA: helix-turn-helix domain-containing protein [Chitinophagaceae bacterium]|nr:helix-turn-helix domain-containing protein [Chitinophagaceae bacterium]